MLWLVKSVCCLIVLPNLANFHNLFMIFTLKFNGNSINISISVMQKSVKNMYGHLCCVFQHRIIRVVAAHLYMLWRRVVWK